MIRRRARKRIAEGGLSAQEPGAGPGVLPVDPLAPKPKIHVIAYGPDRLEERDIENPEEIRNFLGVYPVTWVNVDGLGDEAVLRRIAEIFSIHRLALEDVVHVRQRPKVEPYPGHYYIVTRLVRVKERLESEQVSIFLGRDYVLSFQETQGDCLDPLRERLRRGSGKARTSGPDYLVYAILDAVIDHYFPVLEEYGDRLEALEDEVLANPDRRILEEVQAIRRDLLTLRRITWPQREATGMLIREPSPFVSENTRLHLRDCYDHIVQLMDFIETYRELGSNLMEIYLSSVSNRLNEIMKVLTIISVIFIPLSFIAGVYGMNFDPRVSPWNMPELRWYFGYPFALGIMAAVAVLLLVYFRRKGWIGPGEDRVTSQRAARDASPSPPAS